MADCNIGQTDSGKNTVGTIANVAAVAVAAYNVAMMYDIADKQYDIAKDYLEIAQWWRNYYNSAFKPWEDVELEEAWELEEEDSEYDFVIGQHRTFGYIQFKGAAEKAIQCTSEYCTGLRGALLKDNVAAEARAVAALANLGYRNERAFIEARSDVRWDKRMAVIARGRDMIAENIRFSNLSFGIFGNLGQQAGKAASGAIGFLGYSSQRQETNYPGTRATGGQNNQPQQQQAVESSASAVITAQPNSIVRSGSTFSNGSDVGEAR